jgi:hypothetical protein
MSLTDVVPSPSAPRARAKARPGKASLKPRARKPAPKRAKAVKVCVKKPIAGPAKAPAPTTWTAQFITEGADGRAHVSLMTFAAPDQEAARAFAVTHAPAAEFMLSLYPCSDEQLLEQVRPQALNAATRRR